MKKIIALYHRSEPYHNALFFGLGFTVDLFTLGPVDDLFNILLQLGYLGLASIILVQSVLYQGNPQGPPLWRGHRLGQWFWSNRSEIFHFCLGALLSVYTLFFFKSAAHLASYFFLLFMTVLLLLNELPLIKKLHLGFKWALLSLCLLCFYLILLPILLGVIRPWFFWLAGGLLVLTIGFINHFMLKKLPWKELFRQVYGPSLTMLLGFSLFNLLGAIPPVPLAATYMGVFHRIEKEYPHYLAYYNRPWWLFWQNGDQTFYAREGDRVHFFAAIFSPGGFEDQVVVRWMYHGGGEWRTSDVIPMDIRGGRSGGYRGFTYKSHYQAGDWKVQLETSSGRVIGQLSFEIKLDSLENEREFKMMSL